MISELQSLLTSGASINMAMAFILVFLGGVLTSFTPCIFPMIPIVFSVVTNVGDSKSKSSVLRTVLLFGFGLSISYVSLGVFAVLTQGIFGAILQNIWVKIIIANIFFLIAFNSLGWVTLPQIYAQKVKVHSLWSLVLFGFLTGLTMSPCTLPVLAIVLAFASQQSLLMGAALMWVYSWGFFALLLLIAIFGVKFKDSLPNSGPWLRRVEYGLFALCLGIGEWFLISTGGF